MAFRSQDVYAPLPAFAQPAARPPAGRLSRWSRLAGSVVLPMVLAASIAALAWALPGNGDSQVLAALGLAGVVFAIGGSIVWVLVASVQARAREVDALRAEQRELQAELGSIAHDLRAPLVTANSYFELLAEEAFGRLPAEAREAAERGKAASERARTLAESTLRRSLRRARGEAGAHATSVDLNGLLAEVVTGLRADLAESDAEIEIRDLPAAAADRDALYRVFSNLVENALKYAPPDRRPRILVSGYREGEFATIAVRDWGIGIARREQERIFGLYERAGDATAPGSGIGLATVRRLVQEQGGRVWIDPLITDGTCVRLALPGTRA